MLFTGGLDICGSNEVKRYDSKRICPILWENLMINQ